MANIIFKQGEARTLQMILKDDNGAAIDLSSVTLFLGVKKKKSDTVYIFSKDDADFEKGQAAIGKISAFLTKEDTNQTPGLYVGELKVCWPGTPATIDKSADLTLIIEEAVTA